MLPMMAVGMLVLAGLVGSGVDMARGYMTERRLQAACDAGVLAGRRAVSTNGFDATALGQANAFFDANYDVDQQGTAEPAFTPSSDDDGNTVNGIATVTLDTVIMRIFGFDTFDLSVTCSASMGVGNSDIVFVLDNTGSMAWAPNGQSWGVPSDGTRIYALQTAMKEFYDTVDASVQGSNARIRYGFVPYSSAVNVGRLINSVDSNYIANSVTIQSRQAVNWSDVVAEWTSGDPTWTNPQTGYFQRLNDTRYYNRNSCENSMPADDNDWTANGGIQTDVESETLDPATGRKITAYGNRQEFVKRDYDCRYYSSWYGSGYYVHVREYTRYKISYSYEARNQVPVTGSGQYYQDWVYQPVTYDVSNFKNFNSVSVPVGSWYGRTSNVTSTWQGCIQERQTVDASTFSFVNLATGITPGTALDLDIDSAPTSDDATKWKPLWDDVTFNRGSVDPTFNGGGVNTYCPQRSQLLAEMSESDFDDYADSLSPVGSTYHDLGLLWGARISSPSGIFSGNVTAEPSNGGTVSRHLIFMTDGELAPSMSINSSYGIENLDRRITGNGNSSRQEPRHRSRYLAICEAIKARGIRLWVIAFGSGVTLSSELQTCASANSAFKADNAEELNEQFQEIAKQVGELRVIQ
ncbi:pilus assembly protein TadG-related protein [Croceibacterium atlanticum]|uniref:pilus assembly protein TadG-related protein n=1 Tax=Croceibacterium atlanticum TaxID=1267766 RepID=UPI002E2998E8|nr:pilus assembly protein TadG-related protein [Croceibacterium atlanticum]